MLASPVRILLVSGSLRAGSTNAALLRTAAEVAPAGVSTALHEGLAELPHFNPDDDEQGKLVLAAAAAMPAELERAEAVLFSTPSARRRCRTRSRTCSSGAPTGRIADAGVS